MPIRDTRFIRKAFEQRWPIPDSLRAGLVKAMIGIVADANASPRERTSAFKAILAAEKQNQDDELAHDAADDDRNRFLAIAERLGLNASAGGITDRRTGGGVIDSRIVDQAEDGRARVSAAADEQASQVGPRHHDPAASRTEPTQ
jgi:hypothetical protein